MDCISVIIPVKNRLIELKRALRSVLNQTYLTFEVLVVDDGSEENTESIVQSIGDERIRFFRNPGPVYNANVCRNIGMREAKGEYIAMLDSDDEWLPAYLQTQLAFLKENSADAVFSGVYIDRGTHREMKISRSRDKNESMADYLLGDGFAQTSTHIYSRNFIIQQRLMWDESLFRHQDLDFCIRVAQKGEFITQPVPNCIVHWHQGDVRNDHLASRFKFMTKHRENISPRLYCRYFAFQYRRYVNNPEVSVSDKKRLLKESRRYMKHISFTEFMLVYRSTGFINKIWYRFLFSLRVMFS